jgi:hypothetical protein
VLAGRPLKIGEENLLDVPLGDHSILKPVLEAYGQKSTVAKMLIAIPPEFDPRSRKYPVLIVSSTADGGASSIGAAREYLSVATGKGWVVIATDGEFGKPTDPTRDSEDFRWALVSAALNAMHAEWPASKTWPLATGGVSGGGGYASHQAIVLVDKHFPVIGMFLAVTGWNPTRFPDALRKAPKSSLHKVPVFLSAGETDSIATKEITEKCHLEIEHEGFKTVRFEHFPGGHELHRPHLEAALDWFLAQKSTTSL